MAVQRSTNNPDAKPDSGFERVQIGRPKIANDCADNQERITGLPT